jgi:hypothetical protein
MADPAARSSNHLRIIGETMGRIIGDARLPLGCWPAW